MKFATEYTLTELQMFRIQKTTIKEIKAQIKALGGKGYSKLNKEQLVNMVVELLQIGQVSFDIEIPEVEVEIVKDEVPVVEIEIIEEGQVTLTKEEDDEEMVDMPLGDYVEKQLATLEEVELENLYCLVTMKDWCSTDSFGLGEQLTEIEKQILYKSPLGKAISKKYDNEDVYTSFTYEDGEEIAKRAVFRIKNGEEISELERTMMIHYPSCEG